MEVYQRWKIFVGFSLRCYNFKRVELSPSAGLSLQRRNWKKQNHDGLATKRNPKGAYLTVGDLTPSLTHLTGGGRNIGAPGTMLISVQGVGVITDCISVYSSLNKLLHSFAAMLSTIWRRFVQTSDHWFPKWRRAAAAENNKFFFLCRCRRKWVGKMRDREGNWWVARSYKAVGQLSWNIANVRDEGLMEHVSNQGSHLQVLTLSSVTLLHFAEVKNLFFKKRARESAKRRPVSTQLTEGIRLPGAKLHCRSQSLKKELTEALTYVVIFLFKFLTGFSQL